MVFILRVLHVSPERTKVILKPDKTIVMQQHDVWPSLTDYEWNHFEVQLEDCILADNGKKNDVNMASLTQSEVRDIILGMEIASASIQRQQIADLEKQGKEILHVTIITSKTTNSNGEERIVPTGCPSEQQTFASHAEWRSPLPRCTCGRTICTSTARTSARPATRTSCLRTFWGLICIGGQRTEIAAQLCGSRTP